MERNLMFTTPRNRRSMIRLATCSLVLAGAVSLTTIDASPVAAASTCDRWASANGSDNHDGTTQARAFATLGTLAAVLGPGETGCIPAGDTFVAHGAGVIGNVKATPAAPVTITSGPGGRATIVGGILLSQRSHDVILTDLNIVGDGFTGNALHVEGSSIDLTNLDVRHPLGICIGIGKLAAYQHDYSGIEAENVTISNSRIHDCGNDPSLQPKWAQDSFSGSHGIYVVNARDTRIVDNAIYDNKYRGVQVFPLGTDTLIERNILDGNATHVNVGSTLSDGFPWRSTGTVIRNNVMSNRVTDFRSDKNPAQVHGYLPAAAPAQGNLVAGNCLVDEPGPEVSGNGIEVGGNTTAIARYTDRGAHDFRQTAASPCRSFGPEWARPAALTSTEPTLDCTGQTAQLLLPDDVRSASGARAWTYSRIWHRVDGGDWQRQTWFAALANTGEAQAWWHRVPGASWTPIGNQTDLGVNAGRVVAWEQRFELIDGSWQIDWHPAGSCEMS